MRGGLSSTKETDILDVWFDSGSSSIATLEARDHLALAGRMFTSKVAISFRGWFNSSLMVRAGGA
jgi:isoleucyl-tRNA synthetase